MNLLKTYKEVILYRIALDSLHKALSNKTSSGVSIYTGAIPIVYQDKTCLLGCVQQYYYPKNIDKATIKQIKKAKCYDVRNKLSVNSSLECTACHINCLNQYNSKRLSLNLEALSKDLLIKTNSNKLK